MAEVKRGIIRYLRRRAIEAPKMKITIQPLGTFTYEELARHVEDQTEVGKRYVEIMSYGMMRLLEKE